MSVTANKDLTQVMLFGVETEYAFFIFDAGGEPLPPLAVEDLVRSALEWRLRGQALPFLDSHGGWALLNGGRAYWDRIGDISNVEYSTPETRDPLATCAYVQAGHRFYRALADDIESLSGLTAEVHLSGVCLTTGHANGMHLNYHRTLDEPITVLIPHLISLPCICGAGGWSVRPQPGLEFVRSPRAELISHLASGKSSHDRPLIDTYRKPYGIGRRVQDLSGDATHSMLQLYVRLGSTALLLALSDHWGLKLDDLSPAEPVAAMKIWNRNPAAKLSFGDGKPGSAFDLQRRLLALVRSHLETPAGPVPDWSQDVLVAWERLLDGATDDRASDRAAMDWAVHEALLKDVCAQYAIPWDRLPALTHTYARLGKLQGKLPPEVSQDALLGSPVGRHQLHVAGEVLDQAGIDWSEFEQAIRVLQPVLHLTSTQFLEIGRGISTHFEDEMRQRFPALTDDLIERAGHLPPPDTRASIRAAFVKRLAESGDAAGWAELRRPDGSRINLPDPFFYGSVS